MRVTRGWEECILEIAFKADNESEAIKKVCEGGYGRVSIVSKH